MSLVPSRKKRTLSGSAPQVLRTGIVSFLRISSISVSVTMFILSSCARATGATLVETRVRKVAAATPTRLGKAMTPLNSECPVPDTGQNPRSVANLTRQPRRRHQPRLG